MTDLFRTPNNAVAGPVECLGLSFPNDAARRAHFLAILREKLRDPAFRRIDGFPLGSDEDILALSDPPYYTACPNPFIADFIRLYGKPYLPSPSGGRGAGGEGDSYHKEPFAADVSEGKNDPIYNAHSYHTKVPHKAIMRYILHYTQPGDLVFDGFCGTGMTGVAAQLCGDRKVVESLGYRVEKDGAILEPVQENGRTVWKPFSRLGARRAILNDLSPAATFIAYNYNTPVDVAAFEREAQRILVEVEAECGWMYETRHITPHPPTPSPTRGEGELREKLIIPAGLERKMIEVARAFRKEATPTEQRVWEELRSSKRGYKARRQQPIGPFVVDFFIAQARLVIEIDGPIHESQQENDRQRQFLLEQTGLKVLRLSTHEVETNLLGVLKAIDEAVHAPLTPLAPLSHKGRGGNTDPLLPSPLRGRGAGGEGVKGRINYTVWSDVFICPECAGEVVFWDAAVDKAAGQVRDEFPCPHCAKQLTKRNMERAWVTKFDTAIQQTLRQAKQTPVLINYSVGTKRFEKTPDDFDHALIEKIEGMEIPYWFPTDRMMEGGETRRNDPIGITHVHHFYTRRNLLFLSSFWKNFSVLENKRCSMALMLSHTAASPTTSKMRRFRADKKGGGPLSGTLYISSLITPPNVVLCVERNIDFVLKAFLETKNIEGISITYTQSSSNINALDNSVDYIFIDPPFGANLMYSELNFLWEAWLKVFTNNRPEAIENKVQGKTLNDYRRLMTDCFKEAFRILKPGRWMTIEFSNTQASVWNAIQTAIQEAGFIVANVAALDKKQGSFKAVTTTTAVKQDLVISAYKPNGGLEERFAKTGGSEKSVWDFVATHLNYLPTVKLDNGQLDYIAERDPRILFDRMVAYFIRHNFPVPLSSPEFQAGLQERFPVRDGMIFLPEQLNDYDRARLHAARAPQMELFVSDERSAIDWLTDFLKPRPATYQDLHPEFMRQLGAGWKKHEARPELTQLLEDNFLQDAQDRWYVPDPNKAQELERLRTRVLLKEFALYQAHPGRQLKEFRTEALRAGFKAAYDRRDYRAIVGVAAKLPDAVLQEDEKLLMYYDVASMRLEEE